MSEGAEAAEFDVFLSHNSQDKPTVKRLANAVRGRGLRVWLDEDELTPGKPWQEALEDIIESAKSVAVLVGKDGIGPWQNVEMRACLAELVAKRRPVIPVLLPGAAERPELPLFLRSFTWVDLRSGLQKDGLDRLEWGIRGEKRNVDEAPPDTGTQAHLNWSLVQRAAEAFLEEQRESPDYAEHEERAQRILARIEERLSAAESPRWYGRQPVSSHEFVGREAELWRLHETLTPDRPVAMSGLPTLGQVRGMGGIGKTFLAQRYAEVFAPLYPGGIYWLQASGTEVDTTAESAEAQRIDEWYRIAADLDIDSMGLSPKELVHWLRKKLTEQGRFLWVVDDFPDGLSREQFGRWLPPSRGVVLVTTRSRSYSFFAEPFDLAVMNPEDSYKLLASKTKPDAGSEVDAAKGICEDLGFHALALHVASASVDKWGSFSRFRESLKEAPSLGTIEEASELGSQLPTGHEQGIVKTLTRSIERTGREGLDFLLFASSLPPLPISPAFYEKTLEIVESVGSKQAKKLRRKAWKETTNLSLAELDQSLCSVHILVSWTIRLLGHEERRHEICTATVKALDDILSDVVDIRAHEGLSNEVAHARQFVSDPTTPDEAKALTWVARHDYERGSLVSAQALLERILGLRRRILGDEHPDTMMSVGDLASTLKAQGDLDGARELEEILLATRGRVLGEEHPDTLTSMNNLALTVKAQGNFDVARELEVKAVAIRHRTLGEEHPSALIAMSNLANTLKAQGDPEGARSLEEKVLEIKRKILGEEHLSTLTSMANLALTLVDLRALDSALDLGERVLEARCRILGEDHPATLTSMANLAVSLHFQGDLDGARNLLEDVIGARRRTIGKEHPSTWTSVANLAQTLQAQGDLDGARKLFEDVFEARSRMLGEEHPDTLSSIGGLANTLKAQGNLDGARPLFVSCLRGLRGVLGPQHPSFQTLERNYLDLLQKLYPGDRQEALVERLNADLKGNS